MEDPKEQLHGARVKLEGLKVVMLPYPSIPFPSSPGPSEAGPHPDEDEPFQYLACGPSAAPLPGVWAALKESWKEVNLGGKLRTGGVR